MSYYCIFRVFTCNIKTTILTQFVQYPIIDQITLRKVFFSKMNKSKFFLIVRGWYENAEAGGQNVEGNGGDHFRILDKIW